MAKVRPTATTSGDAHCAGDLIRDATFEESRAQCPSLDFM
jgi:hypothetical protein